MKYVTWNEVNAQVDRIVAKWSDGTLGGVYGIPRGGVVPGALVAERIGVPILDKPVSPDGRCVLVVDDLTDSGATIERVCNDAIQPARLLFDVLFRKPGSTVLGNCSAPVVDDWLVFPWESGVDEAGPGDAVQRLLQFIGEDPTRDGLLETPRRVLASLTEMTAGYAMSASDVLDKRFEHDGYTGLVVLNGIDFVSLCEHHLLPFTGTATVGYIPNQEDPKVVGLSKLARLVEVFARRLQLQERLTTQIADALELHLQPHGAGVVVRAHHACMSCRGVRKPNAVMETSSLRGWLFDNPSARAEFMALARSS